VHGCAPPTQSFSDPCAVAGIPLAHFQSFKFQVISNRTSISLSARIKPVSLLFNTTSAVPFRTIPKVNTKTSAVSDNQENELFAYRIVPYETAESSVLASTHGLSAPLSADVPVPEFLVEGTVSSYALRGAFGTVINLRATFEEWATLNWYLDPDDPVTWTLLDAWQSQGGLQVGANRSGEAYPFFAFADQRGVLNDDIEGLRAHAGEGTTPYFFLQAATNCRAATSAATFTREYPNADVVQCAWIVMTPTVKKFVSEAITKRESAV
jgi:hypothetical protein